MRLHRASLPTSLWKSRPPWKKRAGAPPFAVFEGWDEKNPEPTKSLSSPWKSGASAPRSRDKPRGALAPVTSDEERSLHDSTGAKAPIIPDHGAGLKAGSSTHPQTFSIRITIRPCRRNLIGALAPVVPHSSAHISSGKTSSGGTSSKNICPRFLAAVCRA